MIGIEYGGIELPFVVNSFLKLGGLNILPVYLMKYTHYSQLGDTLLPTSPFHNLRSLSKKNVLILDDNALTGHTVEDIVNDLNTLGIGNIYLGLTGYADARRYHQMIMPAHGSVNPDILLNCSIIVTKSPFTRIYSSKSYKNKNGVFNKVEHKVVKSLIENYPNIQFKE